LLDLPRKKRVQKVTVVDDRGQGRLVPPLVKKKIAEKLAAKKPVLVFLNRRGYASYVLCSRCSYIPRCAKCQIPLSYHKKEKNLVCHYCCQTRSLPDRCPECGHSVIRKRGVGVEGVQEEMKKAFPHAKIGRFDSDSVKSKKDRKRILSMFENDRIDILIGTQLLISQQEAPLASLAVVVFPETLLTLPDFQANRKAFQTLNAVIELLPNRIDSELIIHTALPEFFISLQADGIDYQHFYEREIKFRQLMDYPPFSQMVEVLLASDNLRTLARESRRFIAGLQAEGKDCDVLGPSLAPVMKIRGKHKAQVILKSKSATAIQESLKTPLSRVRIQKKVFVYE
jgi:primosomal protein N' (replication factor Y)